jgi:cytochrome c biogenesis protein CcdA
MHCSSFSSRVTTTIFALLAVSVLSEAVLWVFSFAPAAGIERIGSTLWYFFALSSGFIAAGLPFSLPFILLFAPMIKRDGLAAGGSVLLSLSVGMLLSLSVFGATAAWVGKAGMDALPMPVPHLKDWISFFSGLFVYVLALGEIGLLRIRVSAFGAAAPIFIQKRRMIASAFLLGIFLGSVGIGSISPAIPLLLIESASSGNIVFGTILFAVHALGRIILLFLLALLVAYGFDGIRWLTKNGERITRINGWILLVTSIWLMTMGLFSHGWWEMSRLHTLLVPSALLPLPSTGVLGLPFAFGAWCFLALFLIPLWWHYAREHRRVYGTPAMEMERLLHVIDRLEKERRHLEVVAHIPQGEHGAHIRRLEAEIDTLETKRRVLEDGARYGAKSGLREPAVQHYEEESLRLRRVLYVAVSLLAMIGVFYFL